MEVEVVAAEMSDEQSAFDVALAQFRRLDAPTVIVPISMLGQTGVLYASYDAGEDWMAQARIAQNQAIVAIACCKLAYAEAGRQGGEMAPPPA